MKKPQWKPIYVSIEKSNYSEGILKRLIQEYEPTVQFFAASREPAIGFWTSIRTLMPVIEATAKLEEKSGEQLLEDFKVPKPEIAWTMFRDGLMHSEIPFIVQVSGVEYGWAITYEKKHLLDKNNHIWVSPVLLVEDLKKYLMQFKGNNDLISIQSGKKYI